MINEQREPRVGTIMIYVSEGPGPVVRDSVQLREVAAIPPEQPAALLQVGEREVIVLPPGRWIESLAAEGPGDQNPRSLEAYISDHGWKARWGSPGEWVERETFAEAITAAIESEVQDGD